MIVIVFGLPGTGKSFFASRLAEKLGAAYVNSDRVRKELFAKRTYSEKEKAKVYETLLKRMEKALAQNKDLVLDATFHKKKIRELFNTKSKNRVFFLEVQADPDIIHGRLKKDRPFSEADLKVYQQIKREWEPLEEPHLTLESTNDNIDVMLRKSLEYLKNEQE